MSLRDQYQKDPAAWKTIRRVFRTYFSTFAEARVLLNDCGSDVPLRLESVTADTLWQELIRAVMEDTLGVSLEALAREALVMYPEDPALQALAAGRLPGGHPPRAGLATPDSRSAEDDPERLARALREQRLALFPLAAAPVLRRLQTVGEVTSTVCRDEDLLRAPPGIYLLLGETGCGKSAILGRLCAAAERAGALTILALARAGDGARLADSLPGWEEGHALQVRLVVVDQLRDDEQDLGHLRNLRARFPAAVVLAGGPLTLRDSAAAILGRDATLRVVLPLSDEERGQLLAAFLPSPQALLRWAADDPQRQVLTRSPLFLWAATRCGDAEPLPRMSLVISHYLEQLLRRQPLVQDLLQELLVLIAQHLLHSDADAINAPQLWSLIRADERLERLVLERLSGGASAVLQRLVGLGILVPGRSQWYRARHDYFLLVIAARARASSAAGALPRAGGFPEGRAREVALLTAAFSADPVSALDQVSGGDSLLWLRGVAELPHQELAAQLLPRLEQHLPLGQPARIAQTLRQLRQALWRAPLAGVIGLLQALLAQPSRDPDRMGVILLILEELEPESQSAAVLRERLISSLGPAPPRPPAHALPGGRAWLAQFPVTNQDFAQVFPMLKPDRRSPGPRHPRTGVSAVAARVFARRQGGRLPTAQERRLAQTASTAQQRQHNTPPTARYLVDGGGALAVDDPRLRGAAERWAQLGDNVREWCEDGPPGALGQRYTLGGSFQNPPEQRSSEDQFAHRADVGLRVLWDDAPAPEPRPAAGPSEERMKFLFLNDEWSSHRGGVSTLNRQLCLALAAAGQEVWCFVSHASVEEIEAARAGGVTLLPSDQESLGERERLLLRPPGLTSPPDIIIGHDRVSGAAARVQAREHFRGSRWLLVIHTEPRDAEWYKSHEAAQEGERRALQVAELAAQADGVIAVGPRLARWIGDELNGRRSGPPVHRLLPGLWLGELAPRLPEGLRCLVLGRTEDLRLKGLDLAARAVGALGRPEVELWVRGALTGTAAALQAELGREAPGLRIRVWNYTTDALLIEGGLRQASALLMPSRSEGFGLVALEAIALGVPVLVSDRSGLGELLRAAPLQSAVSAVLPVRDVLTEDASVWTQRLKTIFDNRDAAFQGARQLRQELAALWRWEQAVAELLSFLGATTGQARALASPPLAGAAAAPPSATPAVAPTAPDVARPRCRIAAAVLVSHQGDRMRATLLAQALGQRGVVATLGLAELYPDTPLGEAQERALAEQIPVVLLLSATALKDDGWASHELEPLFALAVAERRRLLLPVFLSPVPVLQSLHPALARWLEAGRAPSEHQGIPSGADDTSALAKEIAGRVYRGLGLREAGEAVVMLDQRGGGPRVGLPLLPANAPQGLLTLVFRPDRNQRSFSDNVEGKPWESLASAFYWSLAEALPQVGTVHLIGESQLGWSFLFGRFFDRTRSVNIQLHHLRFRQTFALALRDEFAGPLPGGGNAFVNSDHALVPALQAGEDHLELSLLLVTDERYIKDATDHIRATGGAPPVLVTTSKEYRTSLELLDLARDLIALLDRLRREHNTQRWRLYTALPFHGLPIIAALLRHVATAVVFLEYKSAETTPERKYVALNLPPV